MAALLLAGCQQYDSPVATGMSDRERASFLALERYFACMRPFVRQAKASPPLSDQQVDTFGYRCLPELEDAARKRELYFSEESPRHDTERNPTLSAPTRAERIKLHEKDLAQSFWCEFRPCSTM